MHDVVKGGVAEVIQLARDVQDRNRVTSDAACC